MHLIYCIIVILGDTEENVSSNEQLMEPEERNGDDDEEAFEWEEGDEEGEDQDKEGESSDTIPPTEGDDSTVNESMEVLSDDEETTVPSLVSLCKRACAIYGISITITTIKDTKQEGVTPIQKSSQKSKSNNPLSSNIQVGGNFNPVAERHLIQFGIKSLLHNINSSSSQPSATPNLNKISPCQDNKDTSSPQGISPPQNNSPPRNTSLSQGTSQSQVTSVFQNSSLFRNTSSSQDTSPPQNTTLQSSSSQQLSLEVFGFSELKTDDEKDKEGDTLHNNQSTSQDRTLLPVSSSSDDSSFFGTNIAPLVHAAVNCLYSSNSSLTAPSFPNQKDCEDSCVLSDINDIPVSSISNDNKKPYSSPSVSSQESSVLAPVSGILNRYRLGLLANKSPPLSSATTTTSDSSPVPTLYYCGQNYSTSSESTGQKDTTIGINKGSDGKRPKDQRKRKLYEDDDNVRMKEVSEVCVTNACISL